MKYQINKSRGFTLAELMIVVAIIGILAAMAGPSYARSIRRAEAMKIARGFESALKVAAFNASTSGRPVKVCATNALNDAMPECLANLNDFATSGNNDNLGWIVFWDINDNDKVDTTPAEKIYKRIAFKQKKTRMTTTMAGNPVITIQPRNTIGKTGTMCIYAPHDSSPLPTCENTDVVNNELSEVKVRWSGLGKVSFIKFK